MGLYDTYASRVRLIAKDADANKITESERNSQFHAVGASYFSAIDQAYDAAEAGNANVTNFLWGTTGAFATGYAQGQAAQPVPVICTSNRIGNSVSTICN